MNDDEFMKLTPMDIFKRTLVKTLRFSEMLRSGVGLRAPWPAMDKIVGMPFLPGWLVLVGARAKGGKSTLLRGLFQAWTEMERRVLYVGSEQSAGVLLFLLAAEKLGIPAREALDPASKAHDTCLFEIEYVQQELANAGIAMVVSVPDLSTETFLQWCKYAALHGFDAVLLDHFHRLATSAGEHWVQRGEDVRKIKTIAEKRELVIVAAAQLRNGEGPLGEFEVPGVNSWAETSNLRRECDLAFQAWRPLKKGVTARDRQMAKEVPGYGARLVQRNTMAIRVDAHRYHEEEDRGCRLSVINGALESYQPDGSDVLLPTRLDI
jgi:DnaB-like helicase C terminal domain